MSIIVINHDFVNVNLASMVARAGHAEWWPGIRRRIGLGVLLDRFLGGITGIATEGISIRELKALEAIELLLDAAF